MNTVRSLFAKKSFIVGLVFFGLMELLMFIGNPHIGTTELCWHHIPEMLSFLFVGIWLREIKVRFRYALFLYIFSVLLGSYLACVTIHLIIIEIYLFTVAFGLLIVFPLPLGYFAQKWNEK